MTINTSVACAVLDNAAVAALTVAVFCLAAVVNSTDQGATAFFFRAFFNALHFSVGMVGIARLLELALVIRSPERIPSTVVSLDQRRALTSGSISGTGAPKKAA